MEDLHPTPRPLNLRASLCIPEALTNPLAGISIDGHIRPLFVGLGTSHRSVKELSFAALGFLGSLREGTSPIGAVSRVGL